MRCGNGSARLRAREHRGIVPAVSIETGEAGQDKQFAVPALTRQRRTVDEFDDVPGNLLA